MNVKNKYIEYLSVEKNITSTNTIKNYINNLNLFTREVINKNFDDITFQSLKNINCTLLETYKNKLKNKKYATQTIVSKVSSIKSLYEFLIWNKSLDRTNKCIQYINDMLKNIKKSRTEKDRIEEKKTYLELEQIALLFKYIKESDDMLKSRTILLFATMLELGLRVSEVSNLKISNINLTNKSVLIEDTKGGGRRTLPLGDKWISLYNEYMSTRNGHFKHANEYIFCSIRSNKLSVRQCQSIVKDVLNKAGFKENITCHSLRRTFATLNNSNIVELQHLMGHSSMHTTALYTRPNLSSMREVINNNPISDVY